MLYRLIAVTAVFGLAGFVAGCSQAIRGHGTGPVELAMADSGRTLQVAPETVVRITLDSNVSTGYSWKLTMPENQIVEKTSQEYIAPQSQRVGEGGRELWTLRTLKAGRVSLRMEYVRPWETKVAPAKVFEVTLVVK